MDALVMPGRINPSRGGVTSSFSTINNNEFITSEIQMESNISACGLLTAIHVSKF
jgi:hypothetical protein